MVTLAKKVRKWSLPVADTTDITERLRREADANALEANIAAEAAEEAARVAAMSNQDRRIEELADFELSDEVKALLAESLANVARNTGSGITDAEAKQAVQDRSTLIGLVDGDFGVALDLIAEGSTDAQMAASAIYKLCFAVQKGANFICNNKYRRLIDPSREDDADGSTSNIAPHDHRDRVGTPYGLDAAHEYGNGLEFATNPDPVGELLCTLSDLHWYLQIVSEAFGWSSDLPMPYMFIVTLQETFIPVTDPQQALDHVEVASAKRRRERVVKANTNMAAVLLKARAALTRAAAKK